MHFSDQVTGTTAEPRPPEYIPTPAGIAAAYADVQAGWTDEERERRWAVRSGSYGSYLAYTAAYRYRHFLLLRVLHRRFHRSFNHCKFFVVERTQSGTVHKQSAVE